MAFFLPLHLVYLLLSLSLHCRSLILFRPSGISFRLLFVASHFSSLSVCFLRDISVELLGGLSLPNTYPLIDHFVLNAKNNRLLVHDPAQDLKGTFGSVVVTHHDSAFINCVFEELAISLQLLLRYFPLFYADFSPHVG